MDQQRGQHHRRADRHHIGFEQVGGHPGAVANVVAHVVGDNGGVAWVVFGNAGLDFADQIGTDIGGLGKDAAAQAGKDRYQRCAQRQRGQRGNHGAFIGLVPAKAHQIAEKSRDREQRQARHQHAGDRTCAKRHGQPVLQSVLRGSRGAHIGAHRHIHADEPGRARQRGADHKTNRGDNAQEIQHQGCNHHADNRDRGVLPLQIGLCALLDGPRNVLHGLVAGG